MAKWQSLRACKPADFAMATFMNSIGSSGPSVTLGERRFGERLKTLLEDDYFCWHNVPVGPKRQYPDFVLLHPRRGLLFFEVKDWRLDAIHAITKHSMEIHMGEGGVKTAENPLEQARGYTMTIVNKLSAADTGSFTGLQARAKH
jgi:Nuclease-related domain